MIGKRKVVVHLIEKDGILNMRLLAEQIAHKIANQGGVRK